MLSCHDNPVGKWDRPGDGPHLAGTSDQTNPLPGDGWETVAASGSSSSIRSLAARWSFLANQPPATRRRVPSPRGDANIAADDEARINDRIRAREVLLIAEDGEKLGVRPLPQALQLAREAELDLVEVAPNASPPVCRIMDYRRWQYEQQQRRKESRKKATNVVIKEMKFRPKIDIHDYTTKMKHVQKFLGEGHKVKLTIMFRGREMAHPELGRKILDRVAVDVEELAIVESAPRQDGRNMTMVLHPHKIVKPKPKPQAAKPESKSPAVAAPVVPAVAEPIVAPDVAPDVEPVAEVASIPAVELVVEPVVEPAVGSAPEAVTGA